ncbi:hypothetical protein ABK040_009821 [Willaertia magna]
MQKIASLFRLFKEKEQHSIDNNNNQQIEEESILFFNKNIKLSDEILIEIFKFNLYSPKDLLLIYKIHPRFYNEFNDYLENEVIKPIQVTKLFPNFNKNQIDYIMYILYYFLYSNIFTIIPTSVKYYNLFKHYQKTSSNNDNFQQFIFQTLSLKDISIHYKEIINPKQKLKSIYSNDYICNIHRVSLLKNKNNNFLIIKFKIKTNMSLGSLQNAYDSTLFLNPSNANDGTIKCFTFLYKENEDNKKSGLLLFNLNENIPKELWFSFGAFGYSKVKFNIL